MVWLGSSEVHPQHSLSSWREGPDKKDPAFYLRLSNKRGRPADNWTAWDLGSEELNNWRPGGGHWRESRIRTWRAQHQEELTRFGSWVEQVRSRHQIPLHLGFPLPRQLTLTTPPVQGTLHCTALFYRVLHCNKLHYNGLHSSTLQHTPMTSMLRLPV